MNQQQATVSTESRANGERPVEWVDPGQLPWACPPGDSELWNMHPRVYLAFDQQHQAMCPYCGARYRLRSD